MDELARYFVVVGATMLAIFGVLALIAVILEIYAPVPSHRPIRPISPPPAPPPPPSKEISK